MAGKLNGSSAAALRNALRQEPLSALQELLGAINDDSTSTDVVCFEQGDTEVFVFFVKSDTTPPEPREQRVKRVYRRSPTKVAGDAPSSTPSASLDDIVRATCERLNVSRQEIVSKMRSQPLTAARALIAHHASRSKAAFITQVAAMFGVTSSSLYVGIKHYRELIPDLFNTPLAQFLEASASPSVQLVELLGEEWSQSQQVPLAAPQKRSSDEEIGGRIAGALPAEGVS
jgi:hypothetical protein